MRVMIACAAAGCLAGVSFGQAPQRPGQGVDELAEPTPPGAGEWAGPKLEVTLTPAGEFAFQTDLKNAPGEMSVARAGLNLTFNASITQQFRLALSTDVEGSWYDFKNATTLIPGAADPFNDMYLVRISPSVLYFFSHQWGAVAGGILEFAGETDADVGDSFTGGGFAGVRYAFSETLAVTLGAGAKTSLEDDPYFFPLLAIEWQITPDVTLETVGLGARITTRLSPQWAFFFQGGYQLREYRLDENSTLPEGVVRDRRVGASVGVTWSPLEQVSVTLRGGATVWQEFKVDNSAEAQVSEINTKPTPFIGLSADFHF